MENSMFWEITEKIGIILGVISAFIGIANFIWQVGKRKNINLKEIFIHGDSNSFAWNLLVGLTVYGVISLIMLPLGLIFPDFTTYSGGPTLLQVLGMLWFAFPIFFLISWGDLW